MGLLESALAIQKAKLEPESTVIADSLVQLGYAHHALGNLDDAAAAFHAALSIYRQAFGPSSPTVSQTHDHLAELELNRSRAVPAIAHAKAAVAIRENAGSPIELARSLDRLAVAQEMANQRRAARESCDRALAALLSVDERLPLACMKPR